MSDLLNIMEWNRWSEEGKTVLEVLTILNNRHLEVVKTLARLRQDLQDPPADVQEAVLDKLNLRSVITQRDLLLEACVNLENDDGSIPASAWNLIQSAVAASGGVPKQIPDAMFRKAYQLLCRVRETEELARELVHVLGFYYINYTDAELISLAECTTGMGEIDPTTARREVIRRHVTNKAQGILL